MERLLPAVMHSRYIPPGVRFNPTPIDVVGYYLPRWIFRLPLDDTVGVIFAADVYAEEPGELTRRFPKGNKLLGHWFFFSPCRRQITGKAARGVSGGGFWHSEQARRPVVVNGTVVGYRQTFAYYFKKGCKSQWRMEEFGLCSEEAAAAANGANGMATARVFCRIYITPRAVGEKRLAEAEDGSSWCQDDAKKIRVMPATPPPPPGVLDSWQTQNAVTASSDQMSISMDEFFAFLDSAATNEIMADQETEPLPLLTYGGDEGATPQPPGATGDDAVEYLQPEPITARPPEEHPEPVADADADEMAWSACNLANSLDAADEANATTDLASGNGQPPTSMSD